MSARVRVLGGICLLATVLVVGCQSHKQPQVVEPPYSVYRSPNLVTATPRRVLLLPVASATHDQGFGDHWHRLLASELRSTKAFDVVMPVPECQLVSLCTASANRGLYDEESLIGLRNKYRVDGVIFARLEEFYPYWPPRMSVSAHLVETQGGETLASLDGNWDARDDRIELLTRDYAQHVVTANDLGDPDLIVQSPEYFGKFVAHQVAIRLCQMTYPDPPPPVVKLASHDCSPTSSRMPAVTPASVEGQVGPHAAPSHAIAVPEFAPLPAATAVGDSFPSSRPASMEEAAAEELPLPEAIP